MKISYNWLQKYFEKPLPKVEEISDALAIHLSEIEGVETKNGDTVFDIKILPDRACYALSHRGLAYELSAILNIPKDKIIAKEFETKTITPLSVAVDAEEEVPRYIGRRIEGVKVGDSPEWLKEKLEAIGQRSINSIVDVLNYVMLDMGQPMHAFDADLVKDNIIVRYAKDGEKITTLDNKEISLDPSILIISDDEAPLAIAGIKGGKRAEVTNGTKNIILEAANFDKTLVRKTSVKVGIKNDSSKRFENSLTYECAEVGMNEATLLIKELNKDAKVGKIVDIYPYKEVERKIYTTLDFINKCLGISLSEKEVISILKRLEIETEVRDDGLILSIPIFRLDLVIPEDIVEEVGRIYGYDKIPTLALASFEKAPAINKEFYYSEKIRDILTGLGFSEVFTYSLSDKGHHELLMSTSDKNFIRGNLTDGVQKSLELNTYNAPLLGLDQIRIFEIGKVFEIDGEHTSLCVGISNTKSWKGESVNEEIRQMREKMLETLNAKINTVCTIDDTGGLLMNGNKQIGIINNVDGIMELNLDKLIEILPEPESDVEFKAGENDKKFEAFSSYPFILRDIAVFVPGEKRKEEEVETIIKKEGTGLLKRFDLFDVFTKTFKDTGEIKTSYAYRLVFQADDKTLSDDEISPIMQEMTDSMNGNEGWMVR